MAIDNGIQYVSVTLVEHIFRLNRDFKPPKDGIAVEIGFRVKHSFSIDKKELRTILTAEIFRTQKNPPFKMTVAVEGAFTADKIDDLKKFSKVHAPAHLLPFVREIIGNTTMKAGIPPLLLPPINMEAALASGEKKDRAKKDAAGKTRK